MVQNNNNVHITYLHLHSIGIIEIRKYYTSIIICNLHIKLRINNLV